MDSLEDLVSDAKRARKNAYEKKKAARKHAKENYERNHRRPKALGGENLSVVERVTLRSIEEHLAKRIADDCAKLLEGYRILFEIVKPDKRPGALIW